MSTVVAPGRNAQSMSHAEQHSLGRRRPQARQAGPVLALAILVGAAVPTAARAQENVPAATAQVEEAAKRFLAAVRAADSPALLTLAIADFRQTPAKWQERAEALREAYAQHPERLATIRETLVDGDFAAVRLDAAPGASGQYLDLILARLDAGWRVGSVQHSPADGTLRRCLDMSTRHVLWRRAVAAEKAADAGAAMAAYKALVEKNPDERLLYARFLQKQRMFDEAIRVARAYAADNPDKTLALETLVDLCHSSGRMREAIEAKEEVLVRGISGYPGNREELLRLWLTLGDVPQAQQHYLAMAADPKTPPAKAALAHLMLADVALREQKTEEARKRFWLALGALAQANDRWQPFAIRGILDQIVGLGWLDDAVKACRRHPIPEVLSRLGRCLEREGRREEMLALYREYLLSESPDGPGYVGLGVYYGYEGWAGVLIGQIVEVGQGPSLVEPLRAGIAEQPRAPSLRRDLGYLLFKLKQYAEAVRELDQFVEATAKPSASFYRWAGDLCRDAGLADKAIAHYQKGLAAEATPEELRRASASAGRAMPEAEGQAALKIPILEAVGGIYKQKQQWADAERCYRAILDLKPRWDVQRHQAALAEVWKAAGKENAFVKELEGRLAKEPDNVALRRDMADALLTAGRPAEAVEQLQRAVQLAPDDPGVCVELARALARAEQRDAAIEQYEKALSMVGRRGYPLTRAGARMAPYDVCRELASLCEQAGKLDRLQAVYTALLDLKAPEAKWAAAGHELRSLLDPLTAILIKRGERAAAAALWLAHHAQQPEATRDAIRRIDPPFDSLARFIQQVENITRNNPKDLQARLILGDLLRGAGRRDEALGVYVALARDAGDDRRLHEAIGAELERLDRPKEALAEYQTALRLCKPGSSEYVGRLRTIADLNLRLGNKAEAAAQYREALKFEPARRELRDGLLKATDGK